MEKKILRAAFQKKTYIIERVASMEPTRPFNENSEITLASRPLCLNANGNNMES